MIPVPVLASGALVAEGPRMLEGPISSVLKGVSLDEPLEPGAGTSAAGGTPGGADGVPRSADGGTAIENDGL